MKVKVNMRRRQEEGVVKREGVAKREGIAKREGVAKGEDVAKIRRLLAGRRQGKVT